MGSRSKFAGAQCSAYGCNKRKKAKNKSGRVRSDSEGSEDEESKLKRKLPRTFHRFPANADLRKKWIRQVRRKDWIPSSSTLLCSDHFLECKIDRTGQTVRLREGAFPERFKKIPNFKKKKRMSENDDKCAEPSEKLAKIEGDCEPFHRLRNPVVLSEGKDRKVLFVHGKVEPGDENAVAILEKKPFDASTKSLASLFSEKTELKLDISNDIYTTYAATPAPEHATFKATMIYPATQKHIDKYRKQEVEVVEETADDYKNITLPYLENRFSVQWVLNILDKKTESERIVFEDADPETGFILLPDMKWDTEDLASMYLIAIMNRRGIKSLRDLTSLHLPLLKNILEQGKRAVFSMYGMPKEKLRIYTHYHPSYYHFHVHFTHIEFDAPGTSVTRAHLLSDVIENIELMGDYYQKKTMTFVGKKNDELTVALRKMQSNEPS